MDHVHQVLKQMQPNEVWNGRYTLINLVILPQVLDNSKHNNCTELKRIISDSEYTLQYISLVMTYHCILSLTCDDIEVAWNSNSITTPTGINCTTILCHGDYILSVSHYTITNHVEKQHLKGQCISIEAMQSRMIPLP